MESDGLILIVDDGDQLFALTELALNRRKVKLLWLKDIPSAKRALLHERPSLVLTKVSLPGNPEGGYRFCQELQQHPTLSGVPVVLVAESLGDQMIQRAHEVGAKGLIPWPMKVDLLRHRLEAFLPQPTVEPLAPAVESHDVAQVQTAISSAAEVPQVSVPVADASDDMAVDEKIRAAELLLQKILHNLKTSNLLQLVEVEDVPRVIYEITRNVCGITAAEGSKSTSRTAAERSSQASSGFDLESAFGLKK